MIRVWDFPRAQLIAVAIASLAATLGLVAATDPSTTLIALASLQLASIVTQSIFIIPYTRVWRTRVASVASADLRVLIVNLDKTNDRHAEVRAAIESVEADVVLLIEIGDDWSAGLDPLRARYPSREEVIRGDGLGIALWSREPIVESNVEHLVSDRRASIHARLRIGDRELRFIGVHPMPPALAVRNGEGRYDSRIRDAELTLVAEQIAEAIKAGEQRPWIVAGDLNDVAWSHTTRLFQRLSGLDDPRIGRALINTFHARRPLLRYPLDHVFLSAQLGLNAMRRVRIPGSDHFGVCIDVGLVPGAAEQPPAPDEEAIEDANEIIEEGFEEAEDRHEAAHPRPQPRGQPHTLRSAIRSITSKASMTPSRL